MKIMFLFIILILYIIKNQKKMRFLNFEILNIKPKNPILLT